MPCIRLQTRLPAPVEECFELSLSVDAQAESMAASGERAVAGVTFGTMELGDTVTWRARHLGKTFTMTSRITEYEAPHRFVDEQVSGPFARWWHEHRFDDTPGGTRMVDVVDFAAPGGPVGRLVEHLLLTRYMTGLLRQRNEWLVEELARRNR